MKLYVRVNFADPKPIVGGGVDLAMHKATGEVSEETRKKHGVILSSSDMYTKAYN
jgi:O-acetyl-ADP-ribose deacetylase (regulator of RNase III)